MDKRYFIDFEQNSITALLGLASDIQMFIRIAKSTPEVKKLIDFAETDEGKWRIYDRIMELREEQIDTRFRHPFDVQIAVYLWLQSRVIPEYSLATIDAVLGMQNVVWSSKMAWLIRETKLIGTETMNNEFGEQGSLFSTAPGSGETIYIMSVSGVRKFADGNHIVDMGDDWPSEISDFFQESGKRQYSTTATGAQ